VAQHLLSYKVVAHLRICTHLPHGPIVGDGRYYVSEVQISYVSVQSLCVDFKKASAIPEAESRILARWIHPWECGPRIHACKRNEGGK
jgi:hypothetical protein